MTENSCSEIKLVGRRQGICVEKSAPRIPPDFLYAALDRSACAAFFTESRMELIDSNKLNRKSGSILENSQPSLRDWFFPSNPTQDSRPGLLSAAPAGLLRCRLRIGFALFRLSLWAGGAIRS
jgi:hypothetical protein